MLTFVINLHSGLPGMALAEPFLYPLQKAEKLVLIFQPADNIVDRLEQAAMAVRRHLERSAYTKWQTVFLVKIDSGQRNPFKDSLSGQMLLIRKLFLENPSINQKPTNNYIVAIDHVNEDEAIPAINISDVYRDSWELDTSGFIRNSQRFFINEQQLASLDNIWKSKVNIDSGTIVNLGFSRLPFELQEKVNQAEQEIMNTIGQILDTTKIDFDKFALTRTLNYIDAPLLDKIRENFTQRLSMTKNDPSRYADFSPANTLKSCVSEQLGIYSEDNQLIYRLIRFPMLYSHEDIFQQHLIKLSVLLAMIANEEESIRSLSKKNYTVNVELNTPEVQQAAYNYLEHLHNVEQRFSAKLNTAVQVQLKQLENKDCSCTETIERSVPPIIDIYFLRKNGDLQRWDEWNTQIDGHLKEYSLQAKRKIQSCIDQNQQKQATPVVVTENKIDERTDDLERSKNDLQGKVEHSFLSTSFAFDWRAYQREQEVLLKPKLFSRPSRNEIIWLLTVCVLVMTLAFTNFHLPDLGAEYHLFFYIVIALIMFSLTFMAFLLARRYYNLDFSRRMLAVYDKARLLRLNIYEDFEGQKEYIKSLCKLNIVRYNYEQAREARQLRNTTNMLLDFHRRKLNEHKDIARKIMRIFNANESIMTSTMQLEEAITEPNVNAPIYENPVYSPVTFMPIKQQGGLEVVRIENIPTKMQYDLARLVNVVIFDRDKIYGKGK